MKVFALLITLLLVLSFMATADARPQIACRPADVKAWLTVRQAGLNRVQPFVEGRAQLPTILDAMLLTQSARRDLEDAPRPTCADELYILTVYYYDALTDCWTHVLANNKPWCDKATPIRLARFHGESQPLLKWLSSVAGMGLPTPTPTRGRA